MGRRTASALAVGALVAILGSSVVVRASSSEESDFVSRINSERTSRGIRAVSVYSDLVEVARGWSQQMASAGQIWHDPNMPNKVSGWTELGDTVGRGSDVATVHDAFMRSDEHRSIILDPAYNQVGVGVADAGSMIYVTEIFVKRSTGVGRPHVTNHSSIPTAQTVSRTGPSTYVIGLTGVVWEIDLGTEALTVSMLSELLALDAPRVDPATGAAR